LAARHRDEKSRLIKKGQMKAKQILRTLVILTILSSNIGCDQISKNIVRQRINYNEQIGLINNYLTLTKIENTGAFLSVGQSLPAPIKILLLTILPLIVLGLAFIYLLTKKNLSNLTIIGICFIVGGGVGNIYDRVIYGSVTDFLHIDFVIFQTGIFNMADVSIMTGTLLVLFESYFKRTRLNYETVDKQGDD
ncbi:MAG: signal peptidase II, partial [Chryseotalea sp.]|jgi:signal peptidase II